MLFGRRRKYAILLIKRFGGNVSMVMSGWRQYHRSYQVSRVLNANFCPEVFTMTKKHQNRIRSTRKSLCLSQQRLGTLCGVSDRSIRDIEHDRHISAQLADKVMSALAPYTDIVSHATAEQIRSVWALRTVTLTQHPICTLRELLVYLPLVDWNVFLSNLYGIQGVFPGYERYILRQLGYIYRSIAPSPAKDYADKIVHDRMDLATPEEQAAYHAKVTAFNQAISNVSNS